MLCWTKLNQWPLFIGWVMVLRPDGIFGNDRSDYGYFPVGKNEQEIKGGEDGPPLLEGLTHPQFPAFWKPWTWECLRTLQHVWAAFKFFLWPTALNNPTFDQALYMEVLLGSSKVVRQPIPGSRVLEFMHRFLQRERRVPRQLLAQVQQTQQWL